MSQVSEIKLNAFALADLPQIAEQLLSAIGKHKIITFYGEMGAGKTTLIKQLCKTLKVMDTIQSPTFSIVNEYLTEDNKQIYHFDFYRIKEEEEALDFGVEEYFYSGNYCFIEWPEKIPNLIPEKAVKVSITLTEDNKRLITILY
ncbi:MAG: tRNA (adenosine(37)-N6)-threonylcarbamoyltransferase complex ATPase subunit type 1 TsaE [Vicingaceae bacterium]|jgi:tRNA threonylcarbamoyladenosine biosynthesis protein TsaE|nr:tRNA (adenosine(37)-N6)-threonylcarbamoyltransferase complex ATPase subunit type 1 TsaE [Flavobacteriales bacterium]MBQ20966.1 tRNA (adenosine(37)-N6)-threonylcarbamoyltransferase complex ATPase subunit type 1 TsaE [Flavobacteriales bacterium]MDF1675628.1 tRNA (adenosine(37)-N6)-threonylcarbamoyltransferase complex ATPase subunit type 1 TsaE [Vicingaceae bacterium]|tara:strand:+ start:91726 stop:92160 length:435 start_codon:yes stop_codon:yes gene_type:complete